MNIAFDLYIQQGNTLDSFVDRQRDYSADLLRQETINLFIDRDKTFEVER